MMSEQQPDSVSDPLAVDFLARLGAAMVAANSPIVRIRRTLERSSQQYGLSSNQVLLLPKAGMLLWCGGRQLTGESRVR